MSVSGVVKFYEDDVAFADLDPSSNADVYVVDEDTGDVFTGSPNADGSFSVDVSGGSGSVGDKTFTVVAVLDDGQVTYRSKSWSFIPPDTTA